MNIFLELIYLIPILLLSLSIHEFSHGYVSHKLGDPTPGREGRLTLNPLAHLDPVGTLVLIFTRRIGWAKPVPVNPRFYNNPRKGLMYVGLAGPGANIVLALFFALIFRTGVINLIIPYFGINLFRTISEFVSLAIIINLSLAVFNSLPVPPLDGSKILRGVLPSKYDEIFYKLEGPTGMMIIMLLAFTGILGRIIFPVVRLLYSIMLF